MKKLILIFLLATGLLSFGQAQASFQSGSDLLERCEAQIEGGTNANIALGNVCTGYVMGLSDTHGTFTHWKNMDKKWCPPDEIHSNQLVRVVVKHLQESPEKLHLDAGSLVANAFNTAFPCEEETI
ncbi:MAG TPA: hypothetical protein EYQ42_11275 [Thiotrichaceae bacterium]|jgi:hypothetical protein|nr:hypothetical protein [Thiotrichaceae bacterium]